MHRCLVGLDTQRALGRDAKYGATSFLYKNCNFFCAFVRFSDTVVGGRGDEEGPGEKQLREEVVGLIERVGRVLEVCGQVSGASSKRGGRGGGEGVDDDEDDDELEDVELPSGGVLAAAAGDPATFADAVEDFLSSGDEGDDSLEDVDVGKGGGGGVCASKKPRFV